MPTDGELFWRSRRNKVHRDGGSEGLICGAGVRDMLIVPAPGMYADLCSKCFRTARIVDAIWAASERPGGGA